MHTKREHQILIEQALVERITALLFIHSEGRRIDAERLSFGLHSRLRLGFFLDYGRKIEAPRSEIRLQALHAIDLAARAFSRPRQFDDLEGVFVTLHHLVEVFEVRCAAVALITHFDQLHPGHCHPHLAQPFDRRVALGERHPMVIAIQQPAIPR